MTPGDEPSPGSPAGRVLVAGAGVSGLAAARRCSRLGAG